MPKTLQNSRYEKILELLQGQQGRLLDIGCQRGVLCHELSKAGFQTSGIDIGDDLIENAKHDFPELDFQVFNCDGHKLPFPDGHFDVVWAGDVIEHICHTDTFVNEINRVTKDGGIFALSTPSHNRIKNVLVALFRFEKHFDPEFPHYRFYTLKSLRGILEKRGFKLTNVTYVGRHWPIPNIIMVVSKKEEKKALTSEHRF